MNFQSSRHGERRTGLEPYREYLEKRWAAGCHNASRLCRELREKGYEGQRSRVKEFLQLWRSQAPKSTSRNHKLHGLRLVAFRLAKPPEKRQPMEQQWVQAISKDHPQIVTAETLAQTFREMVKNRKAGELNNWLEFAEASGLPEIKWLRDWNTA